MKILLPLPFDILCYITTYQTQYDQVSLIDDPETFWFEYRAVFNDTDITILKMKRLRYLYCRDNNNFTDEVIRNLPLQSLGCGANKNFTDRGICDLPLRYLDCGFNRRFTDKGIQTLPLQKLKCRRNTYFTDKGICHLPLRGLSCGSNLNFTDEGIRTLPLKELFCVFNQNFTDEGIRDLALEKLHRGRNVQITESNFMFTNGVKVRATNELFPRVSIYDIIYAASGWNIENSRIDFENLYKGWSPSLKYEYYKFPYSQCPTPVANEKELTQLMKVLPGQKAEAFCRSREWKDLKQFLFQ